MRIRTPSVAMWDPEDPPIPPLEGELSGRWYWDGHLGRYRKNRRIRKERRRPINPALDAIRANDREMIRDLADRLGETPPVEVDVDSIPF